MLKNVHVENIISICLKVKFLMMSICHLTNLRSVTARIRCAARSRKDALQPHYLAGWSRRIRTHTGLRRGKGFCTAELLPLRYARTWINLFLRFSRYQFPQRTLPRLDRCSSTGRMIRTNIFYRSGCIFCRGRCLHLVGSWNDIWSGLVWSKYIRFDDAIPALLIVAHEQIFFVRWVVQIHLHSFLRCIIDRQWDLLRIKHIVIKSEFSYNEVYLFGYFIYLACISGKCIRLKLLQFFMMTSYHGGTSWREVMTWREVILREYSFIIFSILTTQMTIETKKSHLHRK